MQNISRRKLYYSQSLDENVVVKGQASFSVIVKGQGPFSFLTGFDCGRSLKYRVYSSATPLIRKQPCVCVCVVFVSNIHQLANCQKQSAVYNKTAKTPGVIITSLTFCQTIGPINEEILMTL